MNKKTIVLLLLFSSVFFVFPQQNIKASQSDNLPEEAGTYDVPNHPKLKLRVFVYHPTKGANARRPTPTPTITQVCYLADPASSSIVGPTGWRLPVGVHEYRLNKASVPATIGSGNFSSIALNSFSAWGSTEVGKTVTFSEGASTAVNKAVYDGQNIITWGRTSGSALAINYTWYDRTSGYALENDTIFNSNYPWTWSKNANCAYTGYYDVQDILTHELGHRVGLNDEYGSLFADNTMYGYGLTGEVKKNTLTTGDIIGVQVIYK